MSDRSIVRRTVAIGLAVSGVILGHAITYAGLAPSAVAREMLLTATGHGYLDLANRLGVLAVVATLAVVVLSRVVGRGDDDLEVGGLARRLIAFQVGAFLGLEVAERLGSGAPMSGLAATVPTGVVVQAGVAIALALVVRWLLRATDRLLEIAGAGPTPRPTAFPRTMPAIAWHRPAPVPATVGGRAPPRSR